MGVIPEIDGKFKKRGSLLACPSEIVIFRCGDHSTTTTPSFSECSTILPSLSHLWNTMKHSFKTHVGHSDMVPPSRSTRCSSLWSTTWMTAWRRLLHHSVVYQWISGCFACKICMHAWPCFWWHILHRDCHVSSFYSKLYFLAVIWWWLAFAAWWLLMAGKNHKRRLTWWQS